MASQELFQQPAPLEKQAHKNLKMKPFEDFSYAEHLHSALLAGSEFFAAGRSFPVVFVKNSQGKAVPIAVLSLNKTGHALGAKMEGVYVPAFIRRYPFIMDSKNSVLYFDKDCRALQEEEGDALFNEDGEVSEYLNEILKFNKELDNHYKLTEEFVEALEEKELLEPYQGQLNINDQKVKLDQYLIINEQKLHSCLSDEEIVSWFKKGWIAWSYAQISSLSAMGKVVQRLGDSQPKPDSE